jgi:hypothetical protein
MQQPADVVVRPAIKHVPRSVVRDVHERIVRCGLGIVPVSSETEDKFEDAMEVTASSPLFEIACVLVRFYHLPLHHKRESRHHVIDRRTLVERRHAAPILIAVA